MVIGAVLGGITGIVGAMMQAQAQKEATELGYANLRFQRDNARDQFNLATAGRTDAFGNKLDYNTTANEWDLNMTDVQEALADAFEKEQYAGYAEDAPRDRRLKRAQEGRSEQAFDDYDDVRAEYLYSPDQPDKSELLNDAMTDASIAANKVTSDRKGDLRTAAIRMGEGADIDSLLDEMFGQDIDAATTNIHKAKGAANAAFDQATQSWESSHINPMGFFTKVADDVGGASPMPWDTPNRIDNQQKSMAAAIQTALGNAGTQVGSAYSDTARLAGMSPDLSAIANAFASMKLGGGGSKDFFAPQVNPVGGGGGLWSGTEDLSRTSSGPKNPYSLSAWQF